MKHKNCVFLIRKELRLYSNNDKAKILQGFFKTGKGEYGDGDKFLGVTVPQSRMVASLFSDTSFEDMHILLESEYHEERLVALLILVHKYKEGLRDARKEIFDFYIAHADRVNSWDLVDLTAPNIVGAYLADKSKSILCKFARSKNIWRRRIAIVSTLYFIRQNKFDETLQIARILLLDKHDLIQKAVGWMLREVGKRSISAEERFLLENYKIMPRTMLRYAIERFPARLKKRYLER